jgi:hypothetical protein
MHKAEGRKTFWETNGNIKIRVGGIGYDWREFVNSVVNLLFHGGWKFLDQLCNCQLLKDCALFSLYNELLLRKLMKSSVSSTYSTGYVTSTRIKIKLT